MFNVGDRVVVLNCPDVDPNYIGEHGVINGPYEPNQCVRNTVTGEIGFQDVYPVLINGDQFYARGYALRKLPDDDPRDVLEWDDDRCAWRPDGVLI